MNPQRGTIGPEDYQQVREVFEAALKYPAADRAGFVERACSGNVWLVGEVQRMLAADADTHSLLDGRPFIGQGLHEGERFADHFQIGRTLGSGGMGEVYLGRDTKLNREVAIKVLPSTFTGDPDRLARFRREAQVLASLNHPNIGAIYSFEESDGIHALALEYVEGPTLAERIARGPIPLETALSIARQIAEALEAAHEQGIVHRDLKPGNVKLRPDGTVKVLDFGLAKAVQTEGMRGSGSELPEVTSPAMIAMGVMMGTPAYMSPEQVKGRAVDRRADIWAFGAVLYEMLSVRRAFRGEDVPETLSSVLRQEVEWAAIPGSTPGPVRNLIARCLERDPRQRLRDIGEARILLGHPTGHERFADHDAPTPSLTRRILPFVLTAAVAGALVGGAALRFGPGRPASDSVVRLSLNLPENQALFTNRSTVTISPDGSKIVFARPYGLHIRSLSETETKVIRGTEGLFHVTEPAFSPDGQSIAFYSAGDYTLKRIPVTGGAALTICNARGPSGVSWAREGILFSMNPQAEGSSVARGPNAYRQDAILFVPAEGGSPKTLVRVQQGEFVHRPQFLPGGRHLLYTLANISTPDLWDKARIVAQDLVTGKRTTIREGGSDARYVPTGHLVYALSGNLFAMAFNPKTLTVTGSPVPLVEGVMRFDTDSTGGAHYSFAENGTLVYLPGPVSPRWDLAIADRKGQIEPLRLPPHPYEAPRISPDGTQVAMQSLEGGRDTIYVYDLSGRSAVRHLTFEGNNRLPVWTSGGKRIAFQSDREGDRAIFWQRADGSGSAERLTKPGAGEAHEPEAWSRETDTLLFSVTTGAEVSLWMLSLRTRRAEAFGNVRSSTPTGATFSRDGKWVAYATTEGGKTTVYVQPFPPTGDRYELLREGAELPNHPVWAPDGEELFFNPGPGQFKAVRVKTKPTFAFGITESLPRPFRAANLLKPRPYDVLPDGRFIAAISPAQSGPERPATPQIHVILNWFAELRARVPATR